eukprot:6896896-Pyramimonas_sp.AAC.1
MFKCPRMRTIFGKRPSVQVSSSTALPRKPERGRRLAIPLVIKLFLIFCAMVRVVTANTTSHGPMVRMLESDITSLAFDKELTVFCIQEHHL